MAHAKTIRDPKPEVARIESLASRIKEGDILLPKFQRDFIWERQQVLDLFDSISKNYPIGSVLLWLSKNKLSSENSIAGLEIAARAPEYPVNYLLDGQQRLSSICGALYWDAADKNSLWNIVYDLRTESFAHLATTEDPPLHQIRLNKLADATAFFRQVAGLDNLTSADKDVLKERAEGLFNRFKEYHVAARIKSTIVNGVPVLFILSNIGATLSIGMSLSVTVAT
ncbi:MAG: DUF262 domain-containing protein [Pseudomonadota bacterium]